MKIKNRLLSVNIALSLIAVWLVVEGKQVSSRLTNSRTIEMAVHQAQKSVIEALDIANISHHHNASRQASFDQQLETAMQQLNSLQQQPAITGNYLVTIRKIEHDLKGLKDLFPLALSNDQTDEVKVNVAIHLHERLLDELLLQLKQINELRSHLQYDTGQSIFYLYIRALVAYGLISIIVYILIRGMTRQFRLGLVWLSRMTSQIQKGEFQLPEAPIQEKDEFAVLTQEFTSMAKGLRELVVRKSEVEHQIQERTTELESLIVTDPLTGALNRRAMESIAATEMSRAKRFNHSLAVIMADVDLFKAVNDGHGHFAGDQVLVAVSRCLRSQLRDHDFLFRYGGEEFLLLLPETDGSEALSLAERLCERIRDLPVSVGGRNIRVTLSCGVAHQMADAESFTNLVSHADEALYQAKNQGRDRCVPYDAASGE